MDDCKIYLDSVNFDFWYKKIIRKISDKRVVLYGAGILFQYITEYYDLSKLNIIGLSDTKFDCFDSNEKYLGYSIIRKADILKMNPDVILITTKNYVDIILDFENNAEYKNVKILPLIKKSTWHIIKELWRR